MNNSQQTTTALYPSSQSKPRKIVFLDIDGVLNNGFTKERCGQWLGCDTKLATKFVNWAAKNDVEIVLSSTWRTDPSMWAHLNERGIKWIDMTVDSRGRMSRADEIRFWLSNNPGITCYAVLDDIPMDARLAPRHVQVDEREGLTEKHLKKLEEILNDYKMG